MSDATLHDPSGGAWPALPYGAWRETYATLHRWTQIVGKIRLARAAPVNHWWHVPLYVGSRGLTTLPIPAGRRNFQIDFDFIAHRLAITTSDGGADGFALEPRSVADFYQVLMARLAALGLATRIWSLPAEIADPVPFEADHAHAAYDREYVERFWRILVHADRVFGAFRGTFLGKASPVHFFWGSFDLTATRFSGRLAPAHPSSPNVADHVTREAYSHEECSCGFWPGGPGMEQPIFYAYAYPEPPGYADWPVRPDGAFYSRAFGEFIVPYDVVRVAKAPDEALTAFLRSTYEGAATLARWDRAALERPS